MDIALKATLIQIAREKLAHNDPSHDFEHARRVLKNVEHIMQQEGGDIDVLVPAALFHDAVIYPKHHPKSNDAPGESAELVETILSELDEYPQEKVEQVAEAIRECSFHKHAVPTHLEVKILRDADKLEATGVIALMRTFASTGQMHRPFYDPEDPFCERRESNDKKYALDLFFTRLLVAPERMYTRTARELALERNTFLQVFLDELRRELDEYTQ